MRPLTVLPVPSTNGPDWTGPLIVVGLVYVIAFIGSLITQFPSIVLAVSVSALASRDLSSTAPVTGSVGNAVTVPPAR